MKIVILGTAYPYRGGLAAFNERLASQFLQEGHEVEVLTFTLQYPSFLFPGKTQYSSEKAPDGLRIRRVLNSCNPLNWIRVGRQLKKEAPDMLISCYWMSFMAPAFGTVCRIAQRNKHTRCIALVHNMLPHEPSMMDKLFSPYYVRSQQGFVALSESVVKDIEKLDKNASPKTFSPHPIYDHYGNRMSKQDACAALGIDPETSYRYYDINQNARLDMIAYLKELDMSLSEIKKVLDTKDISLIESILSDKNETIHKEINRLKLKFIRKLYISLHQPQYVVFRQHQKRRLPN